MSIRIEIDRFVPTFLRAVAGEVAFAGKEEVCRLPAARPALFWSPPRTADHATCLRAHSLIR
jgi:hypothetical protein